MTSEPAPLTPSALDLLKLDELRDELNQLDRDWEITRRRFVSPQGVGVGRIAIVWMSICCVGLAVFSFLAILLSFFMAVFWLIAIPLLAMTLFLGWFIPRSKRRLAEFSQLSQSYDVRRSELETEIAALRNQLRNPSHGG